MGAGTLVLGWINRVVKRERAADTVREDGVEAAEVARALRTTEELRSGESRMLTVDETNRVFERLERKWGRR